MYICMYVLWHATCIIMNYYVCLCGIITESQISFARRSPVTVLFDFL